MKYIFVTGGVVSSLGKGVATASLGALLSARGHRVTAVKIDPYINIDAGTMRPYEHGEVFVTSSGAETDLDLGNYERFLNTDIPRGANITTGQVYQEVIRKERAGEYLAQTVQVIPHVTDEIKRRIHAAGQAAGADIVLVEVGGTVGDMESTPFLEAIRQVRFDLGAEHTLYVHLTLVPYLDQSQEFKTKPTQHSVAALRGAGITPDVLLVRSAQPLPESIKRKVAMFTSVLPEQVFTSYDVGHVYQLPLALEEQGLSALVERRLCLDERAPDLTAWRHAEVVMRAPAREVTVAMVGKYVDMTAAYLSVIEALTHAGVACDARIRIRWVNAEAIDETNLRAHFRGVDAALVPGGFGARGVEGKVLAARHARESGLPYLGICLGLQVAVIDYARHVAGISGAVSAEFSPGAPARVIDLMPEQLDVAGLGGTMRLGDWPMRLAAGTRLAALYAVPDGGTVVERHRHRYEVNPAFVPALQAAGLIISGVTPGMDGRGAGLVEGIEIPGHPYFVALQAHPEFRSRLQAPSPPFLGLIRAALERQGLE
ncbi:CTP synthase [Deinococcus soli (ex Cha et al. 2016)]|uniref:CTP synthase n=2 Tax=Deinococcus soli (ex Cha et al. 2016) TaxID=1309411 RepID=A0AAE3XDC0_9DEIO|nr:CTP synthase [Deinococcus soli (ex Cha et al. 2016)]MDR6218941.1 CTP synthase [Deinococcus soli (ex Cha et al. 2016)]MDR6328738.1 CTP synthase [Deinococcus soli (ex Cha et al. 2016)]MDR6751775.1 CTP synthase [Deinococcus soli (ex Cha et al. 2016)]